MLIPMLPQVPLCAVLLAATATAVTAAVATAPVVARVTAAGQRRAGAELQGYVVTWCRKCSNDGAES